MNKKTFGKKLRKIREAHGMTIAGLSAALGIKEAEFISWENGETLPSLEQAIDISNAFGVPLDDLTAYYPDVKMLPVDDLCETEKQIIADKIREKSEKESATGKKIVTGIIILEIIISVVSFLIVPNIESFILNIIFFVFLWKGKNWVRYYYIFQAVQTALGLFMIMDITAPLAEIIFIVVVLAIRIPGALLFAFNSSVKDFLYEQDVG